MRKLRHLEKSASRSILACSGTRSRPGMAASPKLQDVIEEVLDNGHLPKLDEDVRRPKMPEAFHSPMRS